MPDSAPPCGRNSGREIVDWLKFGRSKVGLDARFFTDTPLHAVLDTELTSLDARCNRLLSIGAIAMDGMKIRIAEQLYHVVNPGVEVPVESVLVHNLRPNDIEQGVTPDQVLAELRDFIAGRVVVGHFCPD